MGKSVTCPNMTFLLNFGTGILNKDLHHDLNGSCVRPMYKKVQFVNQLENNV